MASGQEAGQLDAFEGDGEGGEDGAWYFDLPQGAWERQEEKNRQLRQSVRENISSSPAPERFGGRSNRDAAPAPMSGWRLAKPGDAAGAPEADVRFPFDPLAEPRGPGVAPPRPAGPVPADEYEATLLRAKTPPSTPGAPAGDDGLLDAMRAWAAGPASPAPPEPPEPLSVVADADPYEEIEDEAGSPTAPLDHPARVIPLRPGVLNAPPVEPGQSTARWDEMFASHGDGGGIVESMREWAQRGPEPEAPAEIPAEFLKPFDWEVGEETPASDLPATALPGDSVGAPEVEPTVVPLPTGEAPRSPRDAWATAAAIEDEPVQLPAGIAAPVLDEIQDWPFAVPPAPAVPPPPRLAPAAKSGGFLARLFGRDRRTEEAPPSWTAIPEGEWVTAEDDRPAPFEAPPVSQFGADVSLADWPARLPGEEPLTAPVRTEPPIANNGWMPATPENQPSEPLQPQGDTGPDVPDDPWAAFLAARDADDHEVAAPRPFEQGPAGAPSPGPADDPLAADGAPSIDDVLDVANELDGQPSAEDGAPEASVEDASETWPPTLEAGAPEPDPSQEGDWESAVPESPVIAELPGADRPADVPLDITATTETPIHDGRAETSANVEAEPEAEMPDDDPWGHVTAASGFDDQQAMPGIFRRGVDPARRTRQAAASPEGDVTAWADRSESPSEPAWQGAPDDDVVLQAFESHVAGADDDDQDGDGHQWADAPAMDDTGGDDLGFVPLLGPDGEDLMDEVSAPPMAHPSMVRLQGWAPQKPAGDQQWPGGVLPGAGLPPPEDRWAADDELGQPTPWDQPRSAADVDDGEPVPAAAALRGRSVIREVVETGLLALLVFLAVRASFQNFKVDGTSMYPTLEDGEFLIVNKLVYSQINTARLSKFIPFIDPGETGERNVFHGPERGDIVVLRDPRDTSTDLIKRVIGLPGETIEIVNGVIYINDQRLEEPYIKSPWHYTGPKIKIDPGHYFIMGDNRENSLDSRNSQVGQVAEDLVIGKAMLSYWPTEKFGLAPNASPELTDQKPRLTAERLGE